MPKGVKWATPELKKQAQKENRRRHEAKVRNDPVLREKKNEYIRQLRVRKKEADPEAYAERLRVRRERERTLPRCIKSRLIGDWKRRGVVDRDGDNYVIMYDYYIQCTHCECCGVKFGNYGDGTGTHKCLDHCHKSGEMRSIVCHTCNVRLAY